jgi:ribose transport system permease protein
MTVSTPELAEEARPSFGAVLQNIFSKREVMLLVLNVVFVLAVARITPIFATPLNFQVLLVGMAMEAVVAVPMVMLLVGGKFDLSVDGVVNMSGIVTGTLMTAVGTPMLPAIGAGAAAGLLVGLVNGIAVTKLKMNPLMTTLGTWWVAQGAAYGLTQGISPHRFSPSFVAIGMASPFKITLPIWYMVIAVIIGMIVLGKTKFGYHIYATGGDRDAARLHGVKVDQITIICYVLVALAAVFTSMVYAARLNSSVPNAVNGLNLRVIAGAVIGGCSLDGGEGSIIGGILGLFFMTMLVNASIILGVSPYWQQVMLGGVVLAAVAADAISKSKIPGR